MSRSSGWMAIRRPGASTLVPLSHRQHGTVLIDAHEVDPRSAVAVTIYVLMGARLDGEVEVVDWRDELDVYPVHDLYSDKVVASNREFIRFLRDSD